MANRIEPEEHIDLSTDEQPENAAVEQDRAPEASAATDKGVGQQPAKPVTADSGAEPVVDRTVSRKASKQDSDESTSSDPAVVIQSGRPHRLRHWFATHKKVVIPVAALVVVLGVLAGVPVTRYAIAGTVIKQDFRVLVVDSQTGKPVSSASVTLKGKTAHTDNKGVATVKVPVGTTTLAIQKNYYKATNQSVLVPLKKPSPLRVAFVATGRQVPVTVVNKISGKALANATISADNTQAITDKNGEATIVLPAGKTEVKGSVTATNYNKQAITIKITGSKDTSNTFQAVPAGKIYFLSNASGTVDVVKADLDGQGRQVVLKGTGKEDSANTVLLAAQNWKYLTLLSKRDGGASAKLFLIDTANDSLTTMDEGDADFTPIGWSGNTFIYRIARHNKQDWDTKGEALKSFEAGTKKLVTLDETVSGGTGYDSYFHESYSNIFILDNEVVYGKNSWASASQDPGSHPATLNTVRPDGSAKKVVKSWVPGSGNTYYAPVVLQPYEPNGLYVANGNQDSDVLYEYENGQLKPVDGKKANDIWTSQYFTYLFSPSNKQTFWSEPRDGKNTLFVGDASANNKKQIASLSEYQTYGWYSDDYLLLSKKDSELYVMPAAGLADSKQPIKVTDYYKPNFSAPGYGKGYGGF